MKKTPLFDPGYGSKKGFEARAANDLPFLLEGPTLPKENV